MWLDHLLSREIAWAGVKSEKTCSSARLCKTKHYEGAVSNLWFIRRWRQRNTPSQGRSQWSYTTYYCSLYNGGWINKLSSVYSVIRVRTLGVNENLLKVRTSSETKTHRFRFLYSPLTRLYIENCIRYKRISSFFDKTVIKQTKKWYNVIINDLI